MHYSLIAMVVVLSLMTMAKAQAPAPGQRLTNSDLQGMLGSKWKGSDGQQQTWTEVVTQADGSAKIRMYRDGVTTEDKGKYTIRDNQLCATFEKVRSGRERCFAIYLYQGRHIWTSDGAIIFTSELVR